jgi:hypothetical protein
MITRFIIVWTVIKWLSVLHCNTGFFIVWTVIKWLKVLFSILYLIILFNILWSNYKVVVNHYCVV